MSAPHLAVFVPAQQLEPLHQALEKNKARFSQIELRAALEARELVAVLSCVNSAAAVAALPRLKTALEGVPNEVVELFALEEPQRQSLQPRLERCRPVGRAPLHEAVAALKLALFDRAAAPPRPQVPIDFATLEQLSSAVRRQLVQGALWLSGRPSPPEREVTVRVSAAGRRFAPVSGEVLELQPPPGEHRIGFWVKVELSQELKLAVVQRRAPLGSPKGLEQRKESRYATRIPVRLLGTQGPGAVITDLSRSGVFVRSEQPAQLKDEVTLALTLEPGATLLLNGVVARRVLHGDDKGMGVQFHDLSAATQSRLDALVDAISRRPRVLLIAHDASFAAHLSRAIDPDQIELVVCGSTVEAMQALTALEHVDLVVVDLELPASPSGTTVLEAVRGLPQGELLKVVALGSGSYELDAPRGLAKARADGVVPRQLPLYELAKRLRDAVA